MVQDGIAHAFQFEGRTLFASPSGAPNHAVATAQERGWVTPTEAGATSCFAQPRRISFHIVARALSAQPAGPSTASSLTYPSAAAASSHTRVSPADP